MRKRGRVDANQKEIVKQLRQLGCSVAITSMVGSGFPDLVVGYKGKNYLIELKDGTKPASAQALTADEIEFMETWRGQYIKCNSLQSLCNLLEIRIKLK